MSDSPLAEVHCSTPSICHFLDRITVNDAHSKCQRAAGRSRTPTDTPCFPMKRRTHFSLRLLIFIRSSSVLLRLNDISLSHKSTNVCDSGGGLRRDVQVCVCYVFWKTHSTGDDVSYSRCLLLFGDIFCA